MSRFASGISRHPVPATAVGEVAGALLEQLEDDDPDLVLCFASPDYVGALDDISFALRNILEPRTLIGTTAVSIIGGAQEIEEEPAFSLFAACLPGARVTPVALHVEETPDGST